MTLPSGKPFTLGFVFSLLALSAALALIPAARLAALELSPAELSLALTGAGNHRPVTVSVSNLAADPDGDALQAQSNESWILPSVDPVAGTVTLHFVTEHLTDRDHNAVVTVSQGDQSATLPVAATLNPLEIIRLQDDPFRSRVYGTHQPDDTGRGAVVILNPVSEEYLGHLTVGINPSGMGISGDGTELFVICGGSAEIHVIDLDTLTLSEIIPLPEFEKRNHRFVGNVASGPNNMLYYTDGADAPRLRVFSRNTGNIVQTTSIAPGNNGGFGHFAVNPDQNQLIGWSQSAWNFTPIEAVISRFAISGAGYLTHQESQHLPQLPHNSVEPGANPVALDQDGAIVLARNEVLRASSLSQWVNSLPVPAYSLSANGRLAGAADGLYAVHTGERLVEMHPAATIQTFTSDFARFVYFQRSSRTLRILDLRAHLTDEQQGLKASPADGSVASLPVRLSWLPITGAAQYHLYVGTSEQEVAQAGPESPSYRGVTHKNTWRQLSSIQLAQTYYWRVDAITDDGIVPGPVRSFRTAPLFIGANAVTVETFESVSDHEVSLYLSHPFIRDPEDSPAVAWTAQSDQDWITFRESEGVTPGHLVLELNASLTGPGLHRGEVSVSANGDTPFPISVELKVLPLRITRISSDPDSEHVFAISQTQQHGGYRAYLLKLDSAAERIVASRFLAPAVSGLAVHPGDNRLYAGASPGTRILKVDPSSLQTIDSFSLADGSTFSMFGVTHGAAGRLLIGYSDPSYGIRIIDTETGLATANILNIRTGGGTTNPAGTFYYHGEANNSGAHLRRYSLSGNQIIESGSIRVTSLSNFGSSIVAMSHDGSRLFWNGSAITTSLSEEWEIGALIHSASADGRLAAGDELIYDVDAREAILGMPKDTGPSAYNASTSKFVAQSGNRLAFFNPDAPSALAAPELEVAACGDTWIDLAWIDRSLETGFTLEMRTAENATWTEIASLPRNATAFSVIGLNPETEYAFRLQANAPAGDSAWSNTLEVTTTPPPPAAPQLTATAQNPFSVLLQWSASGSYDYLIIERRTSTGDPWEPLRTIPPGINAYLDEDALEPGILHFYRVFLARDGLLSESSPERSARPDSFSSISTVQIATIFPDSANSLTLSWNAPPNAQWYEIEYRPQGTEDWIPLVSVERPHTRYRHTGLVTGQTYEYRLRAGNPERVSNYSTSVTGVPGHWTTLIREDFERTPNSRNWQRVLGGQVVEGPEGFDHGSALWFGSEHGTLETWSVDARNGGTLVFNLRAGNVLDDGAEYWNNFSGKFLNVAYSIDGTNWNTLDSFSLAYPNLKSWETITLTLPAHARTSATRIRWQVPVTGGNGNWAITGIRVLSDSPANPPPPDYVLSRLEGEANVNLSWPLPHPGGNTTLSHPESLFQFRVERRLAGGAWLPIGIVSGSAQPSFVDSNAPAYGAVFYRVVTLRPWTESRPSLSTALNLGTQLEAWRELHYGTRDNTGEAADLATDPFGRTNLIRYAFNLDSNGAPVTFTPETDEPGLPAIWRDPETSLIHVMFLRRRADTFPDIEYLVEFGNDLATWVRPPSPDQVQTVNELWERVHYVQPASVPPSSSCFARVRVRRIGL